MTTTKAEAVGPDRIPRRQANGYYRDPDTGDKYRSVTTILNQGVPKDAIPRWTANTVAQEAIDNIPALAKAMLRPGGTGEMLTWLANAADRKKDERADLGSAVHTIIECKILNLPIPSNLLNDPDMAPYIRLFLQFVDDWAVTFEASEMVVANPDELYAGTLDYLLRSRPIVAALIHAGLLDETADPDTAIMGDTKTGGEICLGDGLCTRTRKYVFKTCPGGLHSIKGVYAEAGMQMSAYRAARVAWLRDGSKVPMPPTHPVGIVLHLRPEGYILAPAQCGAAVFECFRFARRVADWTSNTSKTVIGAPLKVPAPLKATA